MKGLLDKTQKKIIGNKLLLKNFIFSSLIQLVNILLPLLTIPYIVRVLGPDLFGRVSFAQSFVMYFTLIINYGFDLTATREIAVNREEKYKLNYIVSSVLSTKVFLFIISTFLFSIIILVSPRFNNDIKLYFITYAINLGYVFFPTWLYQGMEQMSFMVIFNLILKIFFTLLIFIFLKDQQDYFFLPMSYSLGQIIVGTIAILYALKQFDIKCTIIDFKTIFMTLKNGMNVFFSTVAISLYTITNTFVLGLFSNDYEVGLFSSSNKIITAITTIIMMPINMTLFPHLSKLFSQSVLNAFIYVKKILLGVGLLTLLTSIFIFLFSDVIIVFIFGKEFIKSSLSLKILSILPLIIGLSNILGLQIMLNLKYDKEFLIVTILGALICLISNLYFTNLYFHLGSSISWVLTEIFITLAFTFILYYKGHKIF